jgi:hypothetical protein
LTLPVKNTRRPALLVDEAATGPFLHPAFEANGFEVASAGAVRVSKNSSAYR